MLFQKYGLPLTDLKAPAAQLPVAQPRFSGARRIPLSLLEKAEKANFPTDAAVLCGDILFADENGFPALSPVAGKLTGYTAVNHPLYGELVCAEITPAEIPADKPLGLQLTPKNATPQQITEAAKRAGITDELDGQPLYVKLADAASGCFVVADATEAEPFASAAYAVLCTAAEKVRAGLQLAVKATTAADCHIAVCMANAAMQHELCQIYTEKELFFAEKRYPVTVYTAAPVAPVIRIGVQALAALYDAVYTDTAPTACVVTVAGDAITAPQNVLVPFGTPVQAVLDACGVKAAPAAVVAGDAITGTALPDTAVPVVPGITCLLALTTVPTVENDPCIGCGRCAAVCHAHLLPYEIARRLENMHYERLVHLHPEDCDGCGACDCVCPARRDIMRTVLRAGETGGTVFLNWGGNDDV